jgi:hypothetical protein
MCLGPVDFKDLPEPKVAVAGEARSVAAELA